MTAKIELKNVGKIYEIGSKQAICALKEVSFTVETGEFLCIIGPSGCGKSTLLRILAGIFSHSNGEFVISHSGQAPLNTMVFQEYAIFPWRTVLQNVMFGLEMRRIPRKERLEKGFKYLEKVGLTPYANNYPYQLSGGMKQRVAIARALVNNPEVLFMDEPFGALDAQTRTIMQEILLNIWKDEKKTIVYVTHSIEEAVILGDRVVLFTARPGQVKKIYDMNLPRPRAMAMRKTKEFGRLCQSMWDDLVVEVKKAGLEGFAKNAA